MQWNINFSRFLIVYESLYPTFVRASDGKNSWKPPAGPKEVTLYRRAGPEFRLPSTPDRGGSRHNSFRQRSFPAKIDSKAEWPREESLYLVPGQSSERLRPSFSATMSFDSMWLWNKCQCALNAAQRSPQKYQVDGNLDAYISRNYLYYSRHVDRSTGYLFCLS